MKHEHITFDLWKRVFNGDTSYSTMHEDYTVDDIFENHMTGFIGNSDYDTINPIIDPNQNDRPLPKAWVTGGYGWWHHPKTRSST